MSPLWLAIPGLLVWVAVLLLPWRPWSTAERLDARAGGGAADLSDVTVLIPARNEADSIGRTLQALAAQGTGLRVVVIDDQSTDGTAQAALAAGGAGVQVIAGQPLPAGWSGKLWALEQGRAQVGTGLTLLLDADIELLPGTLEALCTKLRAEQLQLVSLMAELRMSSLWERLLLPAFVYFFKLLYPFRLSNAGSRWVAAAAGGCILIESRMLGVIGGFGALRGALIDDCTLARRVRQAGGRTWIGLTRSARSLRAYDTLSSIWNMVARTAFTQLGYSVALLLLCSLMMLVAFLSPLVALGIGGGAARLAALGALAAMMLSYTPTLGYYGLSRLWALAMPLIGTLFLAMTWTSALRCWRGQRSQWKGRTYTDAAQT